MKEIVYILINISFCSILYAQTKEQIEFINHTLDNTPYFERMQFDYNADYILPDSIKTKIIKVLERELPQHFADSVFILSDVVLKNIEEYAWRECKSDTVCFEKVYEERYAINVQSDKDYYYSQCYNRNLILACGSWNVKVAIPYLEKELSNNNCNFEERKKIMEMALAKLGNDSIMKQIKESGTLAYLLANTKLDTINNESVYDKESEIIYSASYNYYQLAVYFKDKGFLYDMLDLLYVKGQVPFIDFEYVSTEISLLMVFDMYQQWRDYPNYNQWKELIDKYFHIYIDAEKNKKERKRVTSHSFKQQMISELKDWIDKNVTFE